MSFVERKRATAVTFLTSGNHSKMRRRLPRTIAFRTVGVVMRAFGSAILRNQLAVAVHTHIRVRTFRVLDHSSQNRALGTHEPLR